MQNPLQPTITVEGGFIVYKAEFPFMIRIDHITLIEYIVQPENARVIGSNGIKNLFSCTRQQFDKLMDDIIKSKDKE